MDSLTSKFVWKAKKPRIKLRILQDLKEQGGLGLQSWLLYYKTHAMVWRKEWITLENKRLLKLEGHDLKMGWHAYVWYGKYKEQSHFAEHILRKALCLVWQKFQTQTYKKIPIWVAPIEAFTLKVLNQKGALL